jgi:hypothetical protein
MKLVQQKSGNGVVAAPLEIAAPGALYEVVFSAGSKKTEWELLPPFGLETALRVL